MKPVKEEDKSQYQAYRSVPTSVGSSWIYWEATVCRVCCTMMETQVEMRASVPSHKLWGGSCVWDTRCLPTLGIRNLISSASSLQPPGSTKSQATPLFAVGLLGCLTEALGCTPPSWGPSKTHYWQSRTREADWSWALSSREVRGKDVQRT